MQDFRKGQRIVWITGLLLGCGSGKHHERDAGPGSDAAAGDAAVADAGADGSLTDAEVPPDSGADASAAPDAAVETGLELLALDDANQLVRFRSTSPADVSAALAISGLGGAEHVLAIDVRPATGQVLGVTDGNRLYAIDPDTGAATPIGPDPFAPGLSGSSFGLDCNPVVDRVRVVSEAELNARLNPDLGTIVVDVNLAYDALDAGAGQDPSLTGVAYTSSFAGAVSTVLYGIDGARDALVTLGRDAISPNGGLLFTVGSLGVDASGLVGFDIGPDDLALAVIALEGSAVSQLYSIDLSTGAATLVGDVGLATAVRGLAILP